MNQFTSIKSSSPPLKESPSSSSSSTNHIMSMQNLLIKDEESLPSLGKIILPLPNNSTSSSSLSSTLHTIAPTINQYYYTSPETELYSLPAIRSPSSSPSASNYTHYHPHHQLNQENSTQN
jgi:hypothetical protein